MRNRRLFAAPRPALLGAAAAALALALCCGAEAATSARIGAPYEAGGVWFVPAADPSYDEQGLAAEYGEGMAGVATFSGERFDPTAIAAAHATLPVPGVVEVTNLDTGKVLKIRINDRGPYAPGRILSLTPAAARALGVKRGASAHVRVRYAEGEASEPRMEAAARPAPAPPLASPGRYAVQVGAFAERGRAERVAAQLSTSGGVRITSLERGDATLYRVTLSADGPAAAEALRQRVEGLGFTGARVTPAL